MNAPLDTIAASHDQLVTQLEEALQLARRAQRASACATSTASGSVTHRLAKTMLRARRQREEHLSHLGFDFGEPAWDLLLDLFISTCEGRKISVSSACVAAAVPSTTALRWISVLTNRGLLVREADPLDGRRQNLRLSAEVHAAMARYLTLEAASREPSER